MTEEIKIGGFIDYDNDSRVFSPEKLIELEKLKKEKDDVETLNQFYDLINQELPNLSGNEYYSYIPIELKNRIKKNDIVMNKIKEDFKKAGWSDIIFRFESKYYPHVIFKKEI